MTHPLMSIVYSEGGKLVGALFKSAILKSNISSPDTDNKTEIKASVKTPEKDVAKAGEKPSSTFNANMLAMLNNPNIKLPENTTKESTAQFNPSENDDTDYRWECCCKHLGAAAILFREAHERAVTDKAVTEGVSEKVMAALNEHAGMDDDLKPMLSNPEAKESAKWMMDGCRQLRRAAWDSRITVGGGTVDDVGDARLWNDMLYNRAYQEAKKHAGNTCIATGM